MRELFAWGGISALGSVMLLAMTNQLCQDVAVIPFLFLIPLALYLASFIICFDHEQWASRNVWSVLFIATLIPAVWAMHRANEINLFLGVAIYASNLFSACMVCHGELVRMKPASERLTVFYLAIAAGGAAGGAFVVLVAPRVFLGYWELHFALLACTALLMFKALRGKLRIVAFASCGVLAIVLGHHALRGVNEALETTRSFHGVLRVLDRDRDDPSRARRVMFHGSEVHGEQMLAPEARLRPTAYYDEQSGVNLAITHHPKRAEGGTLTVGIIGLGVGTLAAFGRPGDRFRFYEIDPEVVRLSQQYFTYTKNSGAKVETVLGDARVSLELELLRGEPQGFDVFVLDAFQSDSIPVHLVTKEAFATYERHLSKDGLIVMHISNNYLDLLPVMHGLADAFHLQLVWVDAKSDGRPESTGSSWVVIARNEVLAKMPALLSASTSHDKRAILFTDDYSNLVAILR